MFGACIKRSVQDSCLHRPFFANLSNFKIVLTSIYTRGDGFCVEIDIYRDESFRSINAPSHENFAVVTKDG